MFVLVYVIQILRVESAHCTTAAGLWFANNKLQMYAFTDWRSSVGLVVDIEWLRSSQNLRFGLAHVAPVFAHFEFFIIVIIIIIIIHNKILAELNLYAYVAVTQVYTNAGVNVWTLHIGSMIYWTLIFITESKGLRANWTHECVNTTGSSILI